MASHKPTLAGSSQRSGAASSPRGDAVDVVTPRRSTGDRRPALRRHRDRHGSGGGTLAHRLAPTGKRILLLERGDYLPAGARQLGLHRGLRPGQVPRPGVLVRQARQRVPAGGQLLRRREHQVLRRGPVPAAAARTSARSGTTAACPRPGRSATRTSSRTTPRPSTCTWSTASTARTPPRGRPARQYPFPPVAARAADPAAQRRPGEAGPAPVPPADRREPHPGRAGRRHPRQRVHPLRPGRRLPLPAGCQVRRPGDLCRPGAGARQRPADDQRLRRCGWRPTPAVVRSTASPRSATAPPGLASARTSWWSPAAR